jgi:hypothetical protein
VKYIDSWDVQVCNTYPFTRVRVSPHSIIFVFKANPNHVLRDEAARAAEEGRDYVSAQGIDQALQVRCASRAAPAPHSFVL